MGAPERPHRRVHRFQSHVRYRVGRAPSRGSSGDWREFTSRSSRPLVASHLRGPTTTVVHVWTTSFLRSAHQTTTEAVCGARFQSPSPEGSGDAEAGPDRPGGG